MIDEPLVAIVGVCAAGKTTLVAGLLANGIRARQVLQEHSYVPDMWQRLTKPDVLVYLDASLEAVRARKREADYPEWLYFEQRRRLAHAMHHRDVYVQSDGLTPQEVLARVMDVLAGFDRGPVRGI